jgi:hypothetical protein
MKNLLGGGCVFFPSSKRKSNGMKAERRGIKDENSRKKKHK